MKRDPVDVVVVGTGAGGPPVALALAQAGLRVVMLEKGKRYRDEDFDHDEIRMARRHFFTPSTTDEPHTFRTSATGQATRSIAGWISCLVGGGTVHMAGYFLRMHPVDFKLKSTLGSIPNSTIVDWPITYADLEPFYAKVEREVGVSGVWHAHPFEEPRSADFPLPPLEENGFAGQIDAACKKLGYHPFPTPRAIVSRDYRGRQRCMFCSLCSSFGCEIGAKSSTLASIIPAAEETGRCEVRPECMAIEIPVDADGRVTGVVYKTTRPGGSGGKPPEPPDSGVDEKWEEEFQPARCVVVACSAIESARLLLLSRSSRFAKGLGNENGLVGKNLVFSGQSKGQAIFKLAGREGARWMSDTTPFVQRSMQDFYLLGRPVNGVRKAGTIVFSLEHPAPIHKAEHIAGIDMNRRRWGLKLKQALREEGRGARTLTIETFAESLPTSGTYVDLDPDIKDKWGLPVARITVVQHSLDGAATRFLAERGMEVLNALEPDSSEITQAEGQDRALQGGTCRFGRDPASSVLDIDCRVHSVPNLYVSDSSFMPSSGGVPPTLTIMANAFRVGANLAARFKAGRI
jgi:choline dehydrogenase-like flavoprotein